MRVDPTGEFWWIVVGALLGGLDSYLCGGDFMQGFAMGAFTGAIGGAVGTALKGTAWGAALAKSSALGFSAVSGAIGGGIMGELSGEGFWEGAKMGALTGAVSWGVQEWFGNSLDKWAGEDPRKVAFANSVKRMAVAVGKGEDPREAFVSSIMDWVKGGISVKLDRIMNKPVLVEVDYVDGTGKHVTLLINAKIADKFKAFVDECKGKGISIKLSDCFRDISKQSHFYNLRYHARNQDDINDRDLKHGIGPNVSRPGSSYHNAGLAFDLAGLSISEMGTVEQIANKYGFYRTVLPKEPWHYSYTNGLQTKDEVAASLGYKNWTTMVDIVQKAYKSMGYPTYKCPYGNDCGL